MEKSNIDLINAFVAVGAAVLVGFICYEPLVSTEFYFLFFEDFSVKRIAREWTTPLGYLLVGLYGILTGIAFFRIARHSGFPFALQGVYAVILGSVAMLCVLAVLAVLTTIAMFALGILALFFGPGDR